MPADRPPVFGIVGWHNAGKTTLMVKLVAELTSRGHTISTVKHAHHGFDVDQSGKDSFRHREAGAQEVMVGSAARWALMHELRDHREPKLVDLLNRMATVDLILVEGFKRDPIPKIEVYRPDTGNGPLMAGSDPNVVAVATDATTDGHDLDELKVPVLDARDVAGLADFIVAHCQLPAKALK